MPISVNGLQLFENIVSYLASYSNQWATKNLNKNSNDQYKINWIMQAALNLRAIKWKWLSDIGLIAALVGTHKRMRVSLPSYYVSQ